MNSADRDGGVRDVFLDGARRYDERQYATNHRTLVADRQKVVAGQLRSLGLAPGDRVLDVACGPGHFLADAQSLDLAPFGLDSSAEMLRLARGRLDPEAGLLRGDAGALPYASASFDAVNCSGLIEYLPDPLPALREMQRVLKPGRHAMIASTNRRSPALLLEPVVQRARGSRATRRIVRALGMPFDEGSLRARAFRLTFHTPTELSALLVAAGFEAPTLRFFHLQFLPHPLERIAPGFANFVIRATDRLTEATPLRTLAEGLLAIGRRPA